MMSLLTQLISTYQHIGTIFNKSAYTIFIDCMKFLVTLELQFLFQTCNELLPEYKSHREIEVTLDLRILYFLG